MRVYNTLKTLSKKSIYKKFWYNEKEEEKQICNKIFYSTYIIKKKKCISTHMRTQKYNIIVKTIHFQIKLELL